MDRVNYINSVVAKVQDLLEEQQVDMDAVAAVAAYLLGCCLQFCTSEAEVDELIGRVTTTAFESAARALQQPSVQ